MQEGQSAPAKPLCDRVILLTGSTGGLGQAVAMGAALAGATLVLHGRVVRKLESLFDRIVDAGDRSPSCCRRSGARMPPTRKRRSGVATQPAGSMESFIAPHR
jgi:NAD(P)-dependent dehydrogenase (short-subunit alcohol dehydrogenase family)